MPPGRVVAAALRAGNMEVRRYETAFLHAKAYIFTPGPIQLSDNEHSLGAARMIHRVR